MTKLDKLLEIARAATPGPWRNAGMESVYHYDRITDTHNNELFLSCSDGCLEFNSKYIATFNPRLIEKMLAEIKAGRELSDHDYILQDTSVVTLTRNYNEAREALDAELRAV